MPSPGEWGSKKLSETAAPARSAALQDTGTTTATRYRSDSTAVPASQACATFHAGAVNGCLPAKLSAATVRAGKP